MTIKINCSIPGYKGFFKEEPYQLTSDNDKTADYFVRKDKVEPWINPAKCILMLMEPPLALSRLKLYKQTNQFHTVFRFNPSGKNQFKFCDDPTRFPYNPLHKSINIRKDTTLTARGLYYAGNQNKNYEHSNSLHGGINLYPVRKIAGEFLRKHYKPTFFFGNGWGETSKYNGAKGITNVNRSWRVQKIVDMNRLKADFILCLENYMISGYVSEKFHDGFVVDRVMLYLGEPNIGNYWPNNCYIDLRKYFNKNTATLDCNAIIKLMKGMSQNEYDTILSNAREYRASRSKPRTPHYKNIADIIRNRMK